MSASLQTGNQGSSKLADKAAAGKQSSADADRRVLASLIPYLWDFRWRVALAISFLVMAKVANIGVPLVMKQIVDSLDKSSAVLAVPFMLLLGYGLLRLSSTLFAEQAEHFFHIG